MYIVACQAHPALVMIGPVLVASLYFYGSPMTQDMSHDTNEGLVGCAADQVKSYNDMTNINTADKKYHAG